MKCWTAAQRAYNQRNKAKRRAARRAARRIKKKFGPPRNWTHLELFKLRCACLAQFSFEHVAQFIPGRSAKACYVKMRDVYWRGLHRPRKPPPRRWEGERLAELHEAVKRYGLREAARQLGYGANEVAGALYRYPPPP